jgi:hypothetical protein
MAEYYRLTRKSFSEILVNVSEIAEENSQNLIIIPSLISKISKWLIPTITVDTVLSEFSVNLFTFVKIKNYRGRAKGSRVYNLLENDHKITLILSGHFYDYVFYQTSYSEEKVYNFCRYIFQLYVWKRKCTFGNHKIIFRRTDKNMNGKYMKEGTHIDKQYYGQVEKIHVKFTRKNKDRINMFFYIALYYV